MLAAWGVYNWNEAKDGRRHGFGFRANYPNDLWNIQSTYAYVRRRAESRSGYMMRNSIQTGYVNLSFQPRPAPGDFWAGSSGSFISTPAPTITGISAGNLETRTLSFLPLGVSGRKRRSLQVSASKSIRDVLPYDFEVAEGVIAAGPYDYTNAMVEFFHVDPPAGFPFGQYKFGPFYSGRYDNFRASLAVKIDGFVNLSFDTNLVRGRLPQGNFTENVYQLKADVFLSPDFGLMNYIQYDDISRLLGWSSRLRWRISAGNEIYLIYNKNWERRWDPTSRFWPMEERASEALALDPAVGLNIRLFRRSVRG